MLSYNACASATTAFTAGAFIALAMLTGGTATTGLNVTGTVASITDVAC